MRQFTVDYIVVTIIFSKSDLYHVHFWPSSHKCSHKFLFWWYLIYFNFKHLISNIIFILIISLFIIVGSRILNSLRLDLSSSLFKNMFKVLLNSRRLKEEFKVLILLKHSCLRVWHILIIWGISSLSDYTLLSYVVIHKLRKRAYGWNLDWLLVLKTHYRDVKTATLNLIV